jgi:two-component system CheB/CheR fusion protein
VSADENPDPQFESLLEHLRQSRGFDFTGYKRPSLMRRIKKRMQTLNIDSFADYTDYLEVRPEEFLSLFNTILINVTSFFRDAPAWGCISETIIPRILAAKSKGEPIRVWSAGCATGEEPYSAAILFCEALGREEFKRRVKIYATDVDEEALTLARQATYTAKDVQPVADALREKYFDGTDGRYVFKPELRRSVIFGEHDLVQDAPMSRLDLLICRNTLMYFNAETQARILGRFNYAMNPDGYLFLGKAEMLLVHSTLFTPVEQKQRIFAKLAQVSLRDRLLIFAQSAATGVDLNNHVSRHVRLRDAAFETGESAQVVVDADGNLLMANDRARQLFRIEQRNIGRPFQDLELSYRPIELRSLIEQAYAARQVVTVSNVERRGNGEHSYLEVNVIPLIDREVLLGVCITFKDITGYHALEDEVQRARQEAETVNEELQASNEELQSTNEELETTNEELQSTNEELETTNEELQSTNEELETMNEELQSANEELQTMNEELRERTDELHHSSTFLTSILSSLRGGIAVVDPDFKVLVWNALAEDLWGLRLDEVKGRSLLSLDIGLPVAQLRNPIRAAMSDSNETQELILEAVNRRGRKFKCRVSINLFRGPTGERQGVVIMMEEMGM